MASESLLQHPWAVGGNSCIRPRPDAETANRVEARSTHDHRGHQGGIQTFAVDLPHQSAITLRARRPRSSSPS